MWVIAETTNLTTSFIRIVVTDDQGRFLVPTCRGELQRLGAGTALLIVKDAGAAGRC